MFLVTSEGFQLWALWLSLLRTGLPAGPRSTQYVRGLRKTHPIAFALFVGDIRIL